MQFCRTDVKLLLNSAFLCCQNRIDPIRALHTRKTLKDLEFPTFERFIRQSFWIFRLFPSTCSRRNCLILGLKKH